MHYYNQGNTYKFQNNVYTNTKTGADVTNQSHKLSIQAIPATYTLTGVTLKAEMSESQEKSCSTHANFQGMLPRKLIIATDSPT
jgi:hypothetical protein